MTSDKVKIGIVGIGNMGTTHVKHVIDLPNTELVAICDHRPEKLDACETSDAVARFVNYQRMLDNSELDGVIIATPHFDHPDMSLLAFERGMHVLVEKPIAVHMREAQRMIDGYHSAKQGQANLVFAAMFMQRTWSHWRKIKSIIDGGELGELIRCSWIITDWFRTQSYYDSGGWRATWSGEGGGVLMNQCPHNLDLYQWMVGMPARVHGFVSFGKHHRVEIEDEVTAYFEHAGGMVGHFITTTGESPGSNRLEITGDKGKLVYEDGELEFFPQRVVVDQGDSRVSGRLQKGAQQARGYYVRRQDLTWTRDNHSEFRRCDFAWGGIDRAGGSGTELGRHQ